MKLPLPSFFTKKGKNDYYLALLLHDEKATGIIIEESLGKLRVVGKGEEYFTQSVEDVAMEELLDKLDRTISKAEEKLPPNVETKKTIFGVKDNWVEEKKIKKDFLVKLKGVCDELDLIPTGFLVISEAVTHLLQEEEGAPVSAVLTSIGKHSLTVSLLRAGRTIEVKTAPLEGDPVLIVDTLLKHFGTDILPTRIILYGESAEELSQQFITHQWSKSLSFLHVPQISLLPKNFDAKAVIYGAATQLGFMLEGSVLEKSKEDIKTLDTTEKHPEAEDILPVTPVEESVPVPVEEEIEGPEEKIETTSPEENVFGFVANQDIALTPTPKTIEPTGKDAADPEKDAHYTIHHYADDIVPVDDFNTTFHNPREDDTEIVTGDQEPEEKGKKSGGLFLVGFLQGTKKMLRKPFSFLRKIGGATKASSRLALFLPPLVIILLIALFLLYIFHVKANVILGVKPKDIQQSQDVTFTLDGSNDFSNNTIAAKAVTSNMSGSVTTDATGTKQTGTPAKGSVTLYSRLTSSKTIASGTVITGANNLQFTLDKDVSIASSSSDASAGPTTASVAVTAKSVGKESNFPSGTKFSFDGFSTDDLVAKNDSAFSGGTQKNVTAIAKSDVEKLLLDLPKSLEEKAKGDIQQKVGGSEQILSTFTDETISKKSFDKNVGDEAKSVTLTGTVTFITMEYNHDDLTGFAQSLIKDKYLQDQTLSSGSIQTDIQNAKKQNATTIQATVAIKAGLLPKIDTTKIVAELSGKSIQNAKNTLSMLPQVNSVVIKLSPNIPFISGSLPRIKNNISVTVQTHE